MDIVKEVIKEVKVPVEVIREVMIPDTTKEVEDEK